MSFNFFTTKRVFRVAQYDRINDFVPFDLSGEKCLSSSSWFVNFTLLRSASVLIHSSLIQHPKSRFSRDNTRLKTQDVNLLRAGAVIRQAMKEGFAEVKSDQPQFDNGLRRSLTL